MPGANAVAADAERDSPALREAVSSLIGSLLVFDWKET